MKRNIILGLTAAAVVAIAMGLAAPVAVAKAGKIVYSADGTKYSCVWKKTGAKVYLKSRRIDPKTGKNWYWKARKECTKV